jgi:CAAX protease family protein
MPWDFALILSFLGVAVPLLGRRRVRQLLQIPATTKEDRLRLYASTMAFQWLASITIFWRASARGITSAELGLALPHPALAIAVATFLVTLIFLNQLIGLRRLSSQPAANQGKVPQLARKLFPQHEVERLAFFVLVVTVAVCEEFIDRGFIQHIFRVASGGLAYVAVFGSAAYFAFAHLYQGRRGLVSTFIIGVVFSTATAWCGSLLPAIAAHFVADFTAGMLAPKYLNRAQAQNLERESESVPPEVNSVFILCT